MAERRPTVYFHLEMGVHLRPNDNNSNNHPQKNQISYMNKSARHRAQQFPRHLPPTTTNYLAPATAPQYQHNQHNLNQPHPQYPYQWYYPDTQAQGQGNAVQGQNRRCSRQENTRPVHGRGRSAPPPLSENSWDAMPEPMSANALPTKPSPYQKPKGKPQIWKELPPTPAQFRLGHDDMPWSPSPDFGNHTPDSLLISPDPAATPQHQPTRNMDDRDKVRTTEMQSLATAMMTVDNGFEDQWWYQGEPRLVNIAGDLISPAVLAERYQNGGQGQLLHPVSGEIVSAQTAASPAGTIADIVSPISDFSSPGSSLVLRRSLTTRSEELYLDR